MKVTDTIFSYPVRKLGRMIDFYRDVLGFRVEAEDADGWTTLRSGHARIALYPSPNCQPSTTHLLLVVDSLAEAIAELRIGGAEVLDVYSDLNLAKFKDPEGNEFALHELPHGRG